MSNPDDPLHLNYWKQQKNKQTQKAVNTGTWTLTSVETEIQRLNLIKEKLLYSQEIESLPSYYFSNFLLGYNKEKKIIVMGSFHGLLRLITPISKFYSNNSINLINMIDGMFRLPKLAVNKPLPWKQLLQIHTVIESHNIERRSKSFPCVWILLPNKKQETYKITIEILKNIVNKHNLQIFIKHFKQHHNFKAALTHYNENKHVHNDKNAEIWLPDKICTDFERGLINSYRIQFNNAATIQGCFFHFTQANIKKIGRLKLRVEFKNNPDFKNMILLLFACAYLPPQLIPREIDTILLQLTVVTSKNKKLANLAFIRYFRRTWLKAYPPSLWSVYGRRDRTNNLLERNNGVIKDYCKKSTYFPDYIQHLCKLDAEATVEYERLRFKGITNFSLKRINQRIKDTQLDQLQKNYNKEKIQIQQYLQSVVESSFSKPSDLYRLQKLLDEYELHIPPDIKQYQKKIKHVIYIPDNEILAMHRRYVFNNMYTEKAVEFVRNTAIWKKHTKMKPFFIRNEIQTKFKITNTRPIDLVNGIVLIQYGNKWSPSFIATAEYRDALAITNDSWKFEIIIDMQNAINSGHVLSI